MRFKEVDVYYDGKVASNYKGIVSEAGELIAITSKKYRLIQHEDIIRTAEEAMECFSGARVYKAFYPADTQAKMYLTILFKEDLGFEPVKGDRVGFGIRIVNSVDMTRQLCVMPYTLRLVCMNGMTHKEYMSKTMKKHYKCAELVLENLRNILIETVQLMPNVSKLYESYASTPVICDLSKDVISIRELPRKYAVKVLNKKFDTVYDLMNELTYLNTNDNARSLPVKEMFDEKIEKFCSEVYRKCSAMIVSSSA